MLLLSKHGLIVAYVLLIQNPTIKAFYYTPLLLATVSPMTWSSVTERTEELVVSLWTVSLYFEHFNPCPVGSVLLDGDILHSLERTTIERGQFRDSSMLMLVPYPLPTTKVEIGCISHEAKSLLL